ncbi:MAG: UDP-N-acetylglucosamine 2-epimerase (non-hydrolyzing), partial [Clostridia bacterium]|nr:UDP-N-acetylglucosamine 2-epimerase (non-hydrolyzing) [Clostridia bacterium]
NKILTVFGTRPEAIKMCPLIRTLRERDRFEIRVAVTGQHRALLDDVLRIFDITSDYDLDLMRDGQDLFDLTEGIVAGMRSVLTEEQPDLVLVHGDTTTAFCTALSAFYLKIPIGHVEAGLRTYDLSAPFPEEWNRRAIGLLARFHYAPTEGAKKNLLSEGVEENRIVLTGNTGIDALRYTVREDFSHPYLNWVGENRLMLLTAHRRENQGKSMRAIFRGIRRVAGEHENIRILCPVHPSPAVQAAAREELAGCERIRLVDALDTVTFHNLLFRAYLCVTDSGGVQEEAASLGKPVLILRDQTERPEGIAGGNARLIGRCEETVYRGISNLLEIPALHAAMSRKNPFYGDGYASERIADHLETLLDQNKNRMLCR